VEVKFSSKSFAGIQVAQMGTWEKRISEWFRDIAGLKGNLSIVHGVTMKVTELEGAREEESYWVVFRDGLTTGEAGHQLLTVTVVVASLEGSHPAIGELLSEAFLRL
jgi:hypothetical protein